MIDLVYWANVPKEVSKLKAIISKKVTAILPITSLNLPIVPITFADLAAARASDNSQNVAIEARLDAIEVKINELLLAFKTV
jgi:hypothetical protein